MAPANLLVLSSSLCLLYNSDVLAVNTKDSLTSNLLLFFLSTFCKALRLHEIDYLIEALL